MLFQLSYAKVCRKIIDSTIILGKEALFSGQGHNVTENFREKLENKKKWGIP